MGEIFLMEGETPHLHPSWVNVWGRSTTDSAYLTMNHLYAKIYMRYNAKRKGCAVLKAFELINKVKNNIMRVFVGSEKAVDLMLAALLSEGHVLIEDVPGSGKTVLAKSFAKSLDCSFRRIQFTPDLLPADITGVKFFDMKSSEFRFVPGPAFANVVLADEINRATPKTQAGLLECMEEHQITVEGDTYALADPFMVIATQNPVESLGVFPLPEAQLDRFMMKLSLGYPTREQSVSILGRFEKEDPLRTLSPVVSADDVISARHEVSGYYVHPDLLDYISAVTEATRYKSGVILGAGTRASLALLRASKAIAAVYGRTYVLPDDIKTASVPVLAHRLVLKTSLGDSRNAAEQLVSEILEQITVPSEDFEKYKI